MNAFSGERLEDGRAGLVRHDLLPEREVMTGIAPVPVKVPRVRNRGFGDDKNTFTPSILPRHLRKAESVQELLPWLSLKGVSTGDFTEALEVLLDLKRRSLKQAPKLAIRDGALGFWTALREVFTTTQKKRCWVHKTINGLNAMRNPCRPRQRHTCTPFGRPRRKPTPPSISSSILTALKGRRRSPS